MSGHKELNAVTVAGRSQLCRVEHPASQLNGLEHDRGSTGQCAEPHVQPGEGDKSVAGPLFRGGAVRWQWSGSSSTEPEQPETWLLQGGGGLGDRWSLA